MASMTAGLPIIFSPSPTSNSIGRFYETFGNGGADTRVRTLRPSDTSREWYRPNPPLAKVKWSARDNINMQESAILFGMNNVASNGQKFLNNFYLKSKRAVGKARAEGPAAWVFPADDPRPAEQASLLNLFELQGIEVHRAEKEIRLPAASSGHDPDSRKEKSSADAKSREEKKPAETVIPAGSYVVRMDQPYSRLADMVLDTQYYSPRDPRSYDDTGWTLGALRGVKTMRITDVLILDAPMRKVGKIDPPGGVAGQGKAFLIRHNTDNTLATLRFRLASVPMEAAEDSFEADGLQFNAGTFILRNVDRAQLEKAASGLGLHIHSTNAALNVAAHPISAPRVGIVHNWQNTQNDGWFRIAFDELKIPYTYVADTWLRENSNLREKFDVLILPPLGGGGAAGLSSVIRGLAMRGGPRPWQNTDDTPNFVAPGLASRCWRHDRDGQCFRPPRHASARQRRRLDHRRQEKPHHLRLRRQALPVLPPGTGHHRGRNFRRVRSRRGTRRVSALERPRLPQRSRRGSGASLHAAGKNGQAHAARARAVRPRRPGGICPLGHSPSRPAASRRPPFCRGKRSSRQWHDHRRQRNRGKACRR